MNKIWKRILSTLLAVSMVCGCVQTGAWASEPVDVTVEAEEPALSNEETVMEEPAVSEETTVTEEPSVEVVEEVPAEPVQEPETSPVPQVSETPEITVESIEVVGDQLSLKEEPESSEIEEDDEQEYTIEVEFPIDLDTSVLADSETLIEGYIDQLFDTSGIATAANYGSRHLDGSDLVVYNLLRESIEEIAAGNIASTVVNLSGVSFQWTYEEMGLNRSSSTDEMLAAVSEMFGSELAINKILLYLLGDCPYDLYWFDKTVGISASYSISYSPGNYAKVSGIKFYFYVSSAYQSNPYSMSSPAVDTEKTSAASKAAENAQAIAAKHAGEPDVQRLTSYRDEICALTSYNYDAASSSGNYGDPWQMIYVFDGDESTNVVCEGYSKAFQYLCDLDGGEEVCYIVTGWMNGGAHMWNLVRLDGQSYLVDVTNSDTGTVGQNGGLFLVNGSDSSSIDTDSEGYPIYSFKIGSSTVTYTYDSDTTGIYPISVLTLGTTAGEEEAIDLSSCTVTLVPSAFTYDGTEKTPIVTVRHGSFELEHETDYTYTFENNVNAGTAAVVIEGTGAYSGTITASFTISKADQTVAADAENSLITVGASTVIKADGNGMLTFSSNNPSVAVVDENGVVTGLAEGTAVITVTAAGDSNYNAGSTTCTVTVSEEESVQSDPIDLSACTFTVSPTSYTYDGTAKTPTVYVQYGETTLVRDTDYTCVYSNNVNAGTGEITLTGKGIYTGTKTLTFTINKVSQTVQASLGTDTISVGETTTITSTEIGTVTYTSDNTSVATVSSAGVVTGKRAGTAAITVRAAGDTNYEPATATLVVRVTAGISTCTVSLSSLSYTYDGSAKKPSVTVKDGSNTLTNGTDYSVSYADNIKAGTATVTVNGMGNYTGSTSKEFAINAASISNLTMSLSSVSYTYNGSAKKPTVTVKNGNTKLTSGTDYTVSYSNNTNAGTATVTATGKGNYTGTCEKNFTISKAGQTLTAKVSSSSIVKGKTATITASGKGTITYSSNKTSIATVNSSGRITAKSPGTAKITVKAAGNSNYKSASKTLTITVKPKAATLKSVKNSSSKKITVKWGKTSGVTGYQIQYSTHKNFSSGNKTKKVSGASKTSATISNLKKGKTYYIRIRTYKTVSGKDYHSAWSSIKSVKIKK